jgi:hypothetical protein
MFNNRISKINHNFKIFLNKIQNLIFSSNNNNSNKIIIIIIIKMVNKIKIYLMMVRQHHLFKSKIKTRKIKNVI